MTALRTIVAGSRDASRGDVRAALASCPWASQIGVVVSGTARGADREGEAWAAENGVEVERFPADWDTHGKAAGHMRNAEMAKAADSLVAVWDGSSRGTANMIDVARREGLRVHVHRFGEGARQTPAVTGTTTEVIDGRGPRLLVLGHAPTDAEVQARRPFVGEHGEILRQEILGKAPPHRALLAYATLDAPEALLAAFEPEVVLAVGPEAETALSGLVGGKKQPSLVVGPDVAHLVRMGWPTTKTRGLVRKALSALKRAVNKAAKASGAQQTCLHPSVEAVGFWRGGKMDGEAIVACASCGEVRKP